jgi:Kef-type K+ transport system membrane component KefB
MNTCLVRIALFGGFLLTSAAPAMAASADEHLRFGPILFGLAVLVSAAKAGGLLAERWGQPSVLGELLVGVIVANLLPPFFGAAPIAFVRSEPTLGVLGRKVNRWAVAIGMVPRGEVGLIFAGIGTRLTLEGQPLLSPSLFSAVVLLVLVTTLVAPIGLRWAFSRRWRPGNPEPRGDHSVPLA